MNFYKNKNFDKIIVIKIFDIYMYFEAYESKIHFFVLM